MTTADRIDSVGYRSWEPVAASEDDVYIGKHRKPGRRSLLRMFYTPRHLMPRHIAVRR